MSFDKEFAPKSQWSKSFSQSGAKTNKCRFSVALCIVITALFLTSCATTKPQMTSTGSTSRDSTSTAMMKSTGGQSVAVWAGSGTAGKLHAEVQSEISNGNTESYSQTDENPFHDVARAPLSTFSIDVDTASYSNSRRYLNDGHLPPADAVRIEEFINYFSYDYPQPVGDAPFSVAAEVSACPWNTKHRLVHIGLQGRRTQSENLPPSNLVFLIDVSGSMQDERRLPLLKSALSVLIEQLTGRDRVAIVTYAGSSGLVLPSTTGDRKSEILNSVERLEAGGSTNGGEGIHLAYKVARENFIKDGVNRVILATDGDFNVGVTNETELVELIEEKRRSGVFLTVLGFGTGNLRDSAMEKLADKGNGNYAYIDSMAEARKVLGNEIGGTLHTIAKDVKIQVEFNPSQAAAYRLVGYENRLLREQDFNDDTKDAGEIGAGHSVTALYEIVPYGQQIPAADVDRLKYQRPVSVPAVGANSSELMTVKLRYKDPSGSESKLLSVGIADAGGVLPSASPNLAFSSAVAEFGMLLKESKYKGDASFDSALALARSSTGADLQGTRAELVKLIETAKTLATRRSARN